MSTAGYALPGTVPGTQRALNKYCFEGMFFSKTQKEEPRSTQPTLTMSWATLGELATLSEPQFSHPYRGANENLSHGSVGDQPWQPLLIRITTASAAQRIRGARDAGGSFWGTFKALQSRGLRMQKQGASPRGRGAGARCRSLSGPRGHSPSRLGALVPSMQSFLVSFGLDFISSFLDFTFS